LLINALVLTLAANHFIPMTLAVLIFSRDGCLIVGSAYKRWETIKQRGKDSVAQFFRVSITNECHVGSCFKAKKDIACRASEDSAIVDQQMEYCSTICAYWI